MTTRANDMSRSIAASNQDSTLVLTGSIAGLLVQPPFSGERHCGRAGSDPFGSFDLALL
jgi:hypothetical protein